MYEVILHKYKILLFEYFLDLKQMLDYNWQLFQMIRQQEDNLDFPREYASIQRQILMPKSVKIGMQDSVFNPIDTIRESRQLSNQLKNQLTDIYRNLNNFFYSYDNPEKHLFRFPDSKFEAIPQGQHNDITYERHINFVPENTFRDHLTPEQLQQISLKGQFEVKSPNPRVAMPYIWKINDYLFKGTQNVMETWKKGLANIYDTFYFAKESLTKRIPKQLHVLRTIPIKFVSLLVGKKSMVSAYSIDYDRQVAKDFLSEILENQFKKQRGWGQQFWDYLYIPYEARFDKQIEGGTIQQINQRQKILQNDRKQYERLSQVKRLRMQQIENIDTQFEKVWAKNRKKIVSGLVNDYSEGDRNIDVQQKQKGSQQEQKMIKRREKQNQGKIVNDLRNRKYNMYIEWIKQQLPKKGAPRQVIQAIVILLNLFQILRAKMTKLEEDSIEIRNQIKAQIKLQYPILSLSQDFYFREQQRRFNKAQKTLQNTFYETLLKDQEFNRAISQTQRRVYQRFVVYRSEWETKLINKRAQLKNLEKPRRTFNSYSLCLPPYQVIVTRSHDQVPTYYLKKQEKTSSDTSFYFWKCSLYAMRLRCWTVNCFISLVGLAILGPTGLRCLCGIDDFSYDQTINYMTGDKTPITRPTVLGVFKQVLRGLTDSRNAFESQPDTGLFGKRFSRLCNLLQCYLFRFFFVGIIIVLILYPIVILLSFAVVSLLAITVWLWVPLVMIFVYLFNILVYQFESSFIPEPRYNQCCNGCCFRAFPIFVLIFYILKSLFLIIVYILHVLVTPLLMILFLVLRVMQLFLTTIRDKIMYCLIACFGRTPSNDTAIAWKISGPGMARSFYNSVHQQDVYILTQCQLEMMFASQVQKKYKKKILQHQNNYNKVMEQVLSPFAKNPKNAVIDNNFININATKLLENFNKQMNSHMRRYPIMPRNVRFTRQEIQNFFPNSIKIVQKFVEKQNIGQWIFDKNNMANGSYEQLANMIWVRIFGTPQVFEPLEKIDERFKLVDSYQDEEDQFYSGSMKNKVGSVMRALQGEVDLSRNKPKLTRFKMGILNTDPSIEMARNLSQKAVQNSQKSVIFSKNHVFSAFVPHLNIQQCKSYDAYQYERCKKLNIDVRQAE